MITFTAMRLSSAVKALIIGLALAALAGCSLVRVSYDNGPSLALWWLDGYLDLDEGQEAEVRPMLRDWFAWHRASEMPVYAGWVTEWRRLAAGDVDATTICAWGERIRARMWTSVERALPSGARLLPTVRSAQFDYLAREFAERLADDREERLPPSADERRARTLDRAVERAEEFYGPLTEAQKRLLAEGVASSPMDAARWLDDRERRQRRFVAALRAAAREPDGARRLDALRAAAEGMMGSADAETAALQARWQAHGCAVSARLHASASPAQRAHLQERLAGWEEDLRALAAAGAG